MRHGTIQVCKTVGLVKRLDQIADAEEDFAEGWIVLPTSEHLVPESAAGSGVNYEFELLGSEDEISHQ
ncbi:MAG TPA: hypothetical protein VMH81_31000 [Bryobacteraceae bacterium]|nr:hypothetical protein [Bryobacteraceae bacterium]